MGACIEDKVHSDLSSSDLSDPSCTDGNLRVNENIFCEKLSAKSRCAQFILIGILFYGLSSDENEFRTCDFMRNVAQCYDEKSEVMKGFDDLFLNMKVKKIERMYGDVINSDASLKEENVFIGLEDHKSDWTIDFYNLRYKNRKFRKGVFCNDD